MAGLISVADVQALLACPTASIHTREPPKDIAEAHDSFPLPVDEESLPVSNGCVDGPV